jgi:hypothetical protein
MISFTTRSLYLRKNTTGTQSITKLGGPYSRSDTLEEKGNGNAKLSRCKPMIYAEPDVKFHSGRRKLLKRDIGIVSLLVNIQSGKFKMQTRCNNHQVGIFDKTCAIMRAHAHTHTHCMERSWPVLGDKTSKLNPSKAAFKGRRHGACHLPFSGILLAKKIAECDNKALISCFVYG